LLDLKDTLNLSTEQVAQIQVISNRLQQRLNQRREDLGGRLNAAATDQGRIFAELQPAIDATRKEVADALAEVRKLLTDEQWQRVPEPVRNPFQPTDRPNRLRRN
ncbi:MAG TPA: Spy/CpxP family protein refolding chaperone, partial [Longimicrobiales bacterium]